MPQPEDTGVSLNVRVTEFFAKAFRVDQCAELMGSLKPISARLKTPAEFGRKNLRDEQEFGSLSLLRQAIHAVWKIGKDEETDLVLEQMRDAAPDCYRKRPTILALVDWLAAGALGGSVCRDDSAGVYAG